MENIISKKWNDFCFILMCEFLGYIQTGGSDGKLNIELLIETNS